MTFRTSLVLASFVVSALGLSQPRVIEAVRISPPPTIDGIIGEAGEWKGVPSMSGMTSLFTGRKAEDGAKFWLAYDRQYIYFAAKLYDSQPNTIRANEYRANVALDGDDSVDLEISPSGNLGDFDSIQMNPHGATTVNLSGGRAMKREWAGEVESKGRVTAEGWEVEARIPWKLLRVPKGASVDMRFNIYRDMSRTAERYVFVDVLGAKRSDMPVWRGVSIPPRSVDHSIMVLPYGYLGFAVGEQPIANSGFDVKTHLTESIAVVGSVNPDFRNIEGQVLSLDFSRFPRLAGESRPFFQEGSEYIGSNIFASQRIPRFDVGLNAYGKLNGPTQFGLIDTVQLGKEEDLASEVSVTPNAIDTYRAAFSHRSGPGLDNDAGLASIAHAMGGVRLFLLDAHTRDAIRGNGQLDVFQARMIKPGGFVSLRATRVTPEYDPGLGFQPEVNTEGANLSGGGSKLYTKGPLLAQGVFLSAQAYEHTTGGFYRNGVSANTYATLRSQLLTSVSASFSRFQADQDHTFSLDLVYPQNDVRRQSNLSATVGVEAEQPYRNLDLSTSLYRRKSFSAQLEYQTEELGTVIQRQLILSGNLDLGNDRALSGRVLQLNHGTNAFVTFQRSGNRGVEYYLIIGDPSGGLIDNRRSIVSVRSTLVLKVVIPLQFGKSGDDKS